MLNNMMDDFNTSYMIKDVPLNLENIERMYGLIQDEEQELFEEVVRGVANPEGSGINKSNAVKEAIDCIYITAQQLRLMGVDVDAALAEVHRSNMSKALPLDGSVKLSDELEIARKRYPQAGIKEGQRKAVLLCGETNKVIKPTTYSQAVITPQMIGI